MIERVRGFRHLTGRDFDPPSKQRIFFEPVDTEVGVWVAGDLITAGSRVLDLGSGSGAAAAAICRLGARNVHGIDISPESIEWAREIYGSEQVTFTEADFAELSAARLCTMSPLGGAVDVVTSNPAYVPFHPGVASRTSIDGGTDGLKWIPAVIERAATFESGLGLTIGSYSSLRKFMGLLSSSRYRVKHMTMAALPLGQFTIDNRDRVRELEDAGEAVLWRRRDHPDAYFVVGFACEPYGSESAPTGLTGDGLFSLLELAAQSETAELEALDRAVGLAVPVRHLVLPTGGERRHW